MLRGVWTRRTNSNRSNLNNRHQARDRDKEETYTNEHRTGVTPLSNLRSRPLHLKSHGKRRTMPLHHHRRRILLTLHHPAIVVSLLLHRNLQTPLYRMIESIIMIMVMLPGLPPSLIKHPLAMDLQWSRMLQLCHLELSLQLLSDHGEAW